MLEVAFGVLVFVAGGIHGIDHQGTEFIIGFCKHINGISVPVLTIINENESPATVNISTPRARGSTFMKTLTVTTSESVRLSKDVIQTDANIKSLAVLVKSDKAVLVQGFNTASHSIGAFLALPVHQLGTEYVVTTQCITNLCLFMIVGTADHTVVTIKLRSYPNRKEKASFRKKGAMERIFLRKYDTIQFQSAWDPSGTYIRSNKPVAVFAGADMDGTRRKGTDNIIEQIPPFAELGTKYVVPFLPDLTKHFSLKITAIKPDTVVCIRKSIYKLGKFQSSRISLHPRAIHIVESNNPILVIVVIDSWKMYNMKPNHNVDNSLSVLYPVNMRRAIMNFGHGYRIRGMFPEGKHLIQDIWYLMVTDKRCDVSKSSIIMKDPISPYAVHAFYIPRLKGAVFNFEPPGRCSVFSGIQWMRGVKEGAMLPCPPTLIPAKANSSEENFFCKSSAWVVYVLSKRLKTDDYIFDFIYGNSNWCC